MLPLDLISLEIPRLQIAAALQNARQKNFRTDTYTNFIFRYKKLAGQAKAGLAYQAQTLESDLLDQSNSSSTSLGADFQNSVVLNRWMPYYTQSYRLLGKTHRWTLRWPLSLHRVQLLDELAGNSRRFSRWVTKPELEWLRNFSSGNTLSLSYHFALDYDQNDPYFFTGYLLRQNRQLSRGVLALNRYVAHEFKARWRANSRGKSRELESFLAFSVGRYDFFTNIVFGQAGQSSEQIAGSNIRQQLRWENRLGGTLGQHWQYKLLLDYRLAANLVN